MQGIECVKHGMVEANGIKMHVAEQGEGPAVLLIHGFPQIWYSWRHQMAGLAARGYHAIAPDLRGYGDTEAPQPVASYTALHLVGDLIALLDALKLPQVFVVGHDWGAIISWYLCLFRPDRIRALVNLSVVFMPRNPVVPPVKYFRVAYGDEFYVDRFQEPGAIEEEFARLGTRLVLRKFYSRHSPDPLYIPKSGWVSPSDRVELPPWLSEQDLEYCASKFDKSGFTGPINYYRCFDLTWELIAPWTGAQVKVPTKFIVGDEDLTYYFPGVKEYIHKGGFKRDVPFLRDVVIMSGVGHFIQEEKPREITDHIYDFIKTFS
ncbi:epoxide hydrolase 1-like [Carex rostrata]